MEAETGRVSTLGAIVVRFGRVLYVVCFLITLLVTAVFHLPHPTSIIANALVVCEDGTSWDAKTSGIRFSSPNLDEQLCGLCTKRRSDGQSYSYCDDADAARQEAEHLPKPTRLTPEAWVKLKHDYAAGKLPPEIARDFEVMQRHVASFPRREVYKLEEITYVWQPSIQESMTSIAIIAGAVLLVLEVIRMTAAYIFWGSPEKPFWWPYRGPGNPAV